MTAILAGIRLLDLSRRRVLRALLAGVVTLSSALALAGLSAWLIARAWQMPPVLDLSVAVVLVRALGISRGVFRYLDRLAAHDVALGGVVKARETLYLRLANAPSADLLRLRRGDLMSRLGDDLDAVGDTVVRALLPMGVAAVMSVGAVIVIAFIAPAAAVVLAIALLVAGVVAPWSAARAAAAAEGAESRSRGEYTALALTALEHADELALDGRLPGLLYAAARADRDAAFGADRASRPAALAAALTPVSMLFTVVAALAVGVAAYAGNGAGVTAAETTAMSPMVLAVLVLLPLAAFEAVGPLSAAAVQLVRSRDAAARIVELVGAREAGGGGEMRPGREFASHARPLANPGGTPWLRARGLRVGHPGRSTAGPFEFAVEPGARLGVVGASGVGKTTLLLTLAGLLPPATGDVEIDGVPVGDIDAYALRSAVGFFAADAHVFATSILENLRVARGGLTAAEAVEVCRVVGLGGWLESLPDGVDTVLGAGAGSLSGGERRRLLLARALVSPARVLLLDEPTEHMDRAESDRLLRLLLDPVHSPAGVDRTVVVVSHRLPAGATDRILRVGR